MTPSTATSTLIGSRGTAVQIGTDGRHGARAAALERAGYDTLWIAGGQLDSLDRIGEILDATDRATVATGIIPLDVYNPPQVLQTYRDLEQRHPGRFLVGLGGPQRPRPLAALNAFLDVLDGADSPLPADRRILAAIGPKKLELARDRAAGAVPLLVTPQWTAGARSTLGPDRLLVIGLFAVLDDDPVRAREAARGTLGFLVGVPGYAASLRRMGFSDPEIDALDDRLLDALVAHGSEAEIGARAVAHRAAGADQINLTVLPSEAAPDVLGAAIRLAGVLPD